MDKRFISISWTLKLRKKPSLFLWLILLFPSSLFGQQVYQGITLDEATIREIRRGFDLDAFIERVQQDSSYYKAFKTLRIKSYTMYSDIEVYDSEREPKAKYNSVIKQQVQNNCRTMQVQSEKVHGDFYKKNKQYRYLTAEFYDRLFFTHDTVCGDDNIVNGQLASSDHNRINQLKQLVFNPGQEIRGVPGIGHKLGIFDERERDKYDFTLRYKPYNDTYCYVFRVVPKEAFEKQLVINNLETWFRASDYAIMSRTYALSFRTLIYDFDVDMHVKLKEVSGQLMPYEIDYQGDWHIFGKPREKAHFFTLLTDFN